MSFEERRTWIEAVVTLLVPGWYFVAVLSQAATTPVAEIEYQWALGLSVVLVILTVVVGVIVGTVAAHVGGEVAAARAGVSRDREATAAMAAAIERTDERDVAIGRFAGQFGFAVLGIGVLVPLGLAMAEREPFWIANALYAALVLASLASSAVKLVAYRRGF